MGVAVAADKAGHDRDAREVGKGFAHTLVGQVAVQDVAPVLLLGDDEIEGVDTAGSAYHGCNDVGADALTIADDGVVRFLAEVVDQINAEEDALQLV